MYFPPPWLYWFNILILRFIHVEVNTNSYFCCCCCSWLQFHCMDIGQFIYSFIYYCWTFGWLPCWKHMSIQSLENKAAKNVCISLSMDIWFHIRLCMDIRFHFSWLNTKECKNLTVWSLWERQLKYKDTEGLIFQG